jgi:PAS domain S-box-containing protein
MKGLVQSLNMNVHSSRGRLLLLVLLVVIPAFVVQVIGAWTDLQQQIEERKLQVVQVMDHAGADFGTQLDQSRAIFADLVRMNEMRRPYNCAQMFNALRFAYERLAPEATNIGLSDAKGNIYCSVAPVVGETNISRQSHFRAALETLDFALGSYALNPLSGIPTVKVAYPALTFDGQVQTVVFVEFELQWLSRWQTEVVLPVDSSITLISPDGLILERMVDGEQITTRSTVQKAAWFSPLMDGSRAVIEAADLDGVRRLHTLVPLVHESQTAAYLHLGYPVEELYAKVNQSLQWKLALLGITLVIALFVAWLGSERLFLHPLRSLLRVVGEVQLGNFQARTAQVGGVSELTVLAGAFDRMANALQQREKDRQQAQADMQKSDARFRAVFENAAVGMAVMTLDRHIIEINQRACQLTGYSLEEMYELNPSLLAVEEDRAIDRHLFMELLEGERDQYTAEKRYLRKDGSMFWGRVNFSAVRGADGKTAYTIGMIEDITEEKRSAERLAAQDAEHRRMLEQRIAERTQELNQANERLQQKAAQDAVAAERSRLARELHDAVTQTLFSATLIADVLPELWEINMVEGKRRLAELHQLTRGALAEMRALLVELRPNALIEIPLPTLLRQLTEAVIGRARIQIQLSVEGQRKLPGEVQVGLYRITQEALNNVVKHSQATQAMVTLRLGDSVRLTVADNGAGFDPSTITADHLGLKIMRERADAIGAHISIYSEPGEGAQISVTWQ